MYIIITGASRGIGKELAYVFASHKYDLFITCKKNIGLLEEVKRDIENKYQVNVLTKWGHINEKDLGQIKDLYIVINNASVCQYKLVQDVNETEFDDIVDSNLKDCFLTTKFAIKKMIKKKLGIIVNISSVWGIIGSSNESIYSMTKGGIIAFTKSIAKELKPSNIDCISISLGIIKTDMIKDIDDLEIKKIENKLYDKKIWDAKTTAQKIYDEIYKKNYSTGDNIILDNGLM